MLGFLSAPDDGLADGCLDGVEGLAAEDFLLSFDDCLVCDPEAALLVCEDCDEDCEDLLVCASASDINAANARTASIDAIVFLIDPMI